MNPISLNRIRAARAIAICTDLIQVGFPYIFGEGFLSPFDAALDVAACLALTALVGWHNAFIPAFLVELLPIADFAPTWTIAAFMATRGIQPAATQTTPAPATPQDHKGRPLGLASAAERGSTSMITPPEQTLGSRSHFWDPPNAGNKD